MQSALEFKLSLNNKTSYRKGRSEVKLISNSFSSRSASDDDAVQCIGEYILKNIHSKRRNMFDLYCANVKGHSRHDSFSLPDIVREANQYKMIKNHLQNQDFTRLLLENQERKQSVTNSYNDKDIIISHKFSNRNQKRNKSHIIRQAKLIKQSKKLLPIEPRVEKTKQNLVQILNPQQLPIVNIQKRKKVGSKAKFQKYNEGYVINPWQNVGKQGIVSQQSYNLLL